MITFSVEPFSSIKDEIKGLWQKHYDELILDKEKFVLDPDIEQYEAIERNKLLHITVARKNGIMVGYIFAILGRHLHYKNIIFASHDLYYVLPEFRAPRAFKRLMLASENSLKSKGINYLHSRTKLRKSALRSFEALGWKPIETTLTKWI